MLPVARMCRLPCSHPRCILVPAKVLAVRLLLEPPALALCFARLAAHPLAAVALPAPIARVRHEKPPAAKALALAVDMHRPTASPGATAPTNPGRLISRGEEHPPQAEEDSSLSESGRKSSRRTTDFRPPLLHGFHSAAGIRDMAESCGTLFNRREVALVALKRRLDHRNHPRHRDIQWEDDSAQWQGDRPDGKGVRPHLQHDRPVGGRRTHRRVRLRGPSSSGAADWPRLGPESHRNGRDYKARSHDPRRSRRSRFNPFPMYSPMFKPP